ncbi:hypothetical protein PVK06_049697 [Gossypium arboreum]|uniref:Uncharacterized protein n=1 Tax=Gossypium arboreum TaxID=29729 RepID=A0ABR0MJD5_GOSAR|nr:hypothetical protein PVK06_049697 [Gossypium arboreum]
MNTRTNIPATTTAAATDVLDAITTYSVVATVRFAKAAQSSTTKYIAETSSIRLNIKFLASIVSIIGSCSGDTIKFILRIMIARKCSIDHVDDQVTIDPSTNAFLLMRCQSTPTKSWLEEANRAE